MLLNLFLNLLLSNISNYLNIFLLFNRIYRPLLVGNDHDALIFFNFLGNFDFSGFSPNMIMTNQKGPVNSIKKQKYIQIVGNISLQHVQEQI